MAASDVSISETYFDLKSSQINLLTTINKLLTIRANSDFIHYDSI